MTAKLSVTMDGVGPLYVHDSSIRYAGSPEFEATMGEHLRANARRTEDIVRELLSRWVSECEPTLMIGLGTFDIRGLGLAGDLSEFPVVVVPVQHWVGGFDLGAEPPSTVMWPGAPKDLEPPYNRVLVLPPSHPWASQEKVREHFGPNVKFIKAQKLPT